MNVSRRALTAGALSLGVALNTRGAFAQAPQKLTVRVDWTPWGMHAALHLGVAKGWFQEAGLDVTVSDGRGSSLTMQQVAAGEIDIGWVQLAPMAIARGRGMPLTSVAGLARRGELGALVPKGMNIKTVKDLEGKKVAYTANSSWGPLIDPFFTRGGADKSKISLVNVDSSTLLSAYVSGAVDATLTTYPFAKPTADRQRPSDGLLLSDVGINLPSYGLVTTPRVIESKEDALRRFVPVVVRAWEYIHAGNVDEAVQAIVKQRPNDKLDAEIMRDQINEYKPFFFTEETKGKRYGWQSEEDWKGTIAILEETKAIPAGSKPSDYYTNRFVPN
jgi:NitT/TauT family transport system substrate-binding protein